MTTRLFLVRHGESQWNPLSRYAGRRDVPLTERGREQARRLAHRLAGEQLTAIYSSALHRARETATLVASLSRLPVILDPHLAEINHGAWEGMTTSEVACQFPDEYTLWQSHPHAVVMPDGERLADVQARVQVTLDRILNRQCDGAVMVCAHDAVLRVMVLQCLNLGLEHFGKLCFENGSLSQLEQAPGGGRGWKLIGLNDTSHLVGVSSEYASQAL